LSDLKTLPAVQVNASATAHNEQGQTIMRITVSNPGKSLGFQVHLRVAGAGGEDVLPVFFDDNYFPLFPGEKRTITARFEASQISGPPHVVVDGWNVKELKVETKIVDGSAQTHSRQAEPSMKAVAAQPATKTQ